MSLRGSYRVLAVIAFLGASCASDEYTEETDRSPYTHAFTVLQEYYAKHNPDKEAHEIGRMVNKAKRTDDLEQLFGECEAKYGEHPVDLWQKTHPEDLKVLRSNSIIAQVRYFFRDHGADLLKLKYVGYTLIFGLLAVACYTINDAIINPRGEFGREALNKNRTPEERQRQRMERANSGGTLGKVAARGGDSLEKRLSSALDKIEKEAGDAEPTRPGKTSWRAKRAEEATESTAPEEQTVGNKSGGRKDTCMDCYSAAEAGRLAIRRVRGGRQRCWFGDTCYRQAAPHVAKFTHVGDEDWWLMDKPVQVNITGATQRELAASFDAFTAAGGKLGVVPIQAARRYIAQETALLPHFMKQVFAKAQQYIHLRPDARTMRADQFCIALQAAEACRNLLEGGAITLSELVDLRLAVDVAAKSTAGADVIQEAMQARGGASGHARAQPVDDEVLRAKARREKLARERAEETR